MRRRSLACTPSSISPISSRKIVPPSAWAKRPIRVELAPVNERAGGLDLVLIGANDPAAMIRHSQECRSRGYAFVADPSQQLARMDGSDVLSLIRGAEYLMTNEYERSLLETKAGLTSEQVLLSGILRNKFHDGGRLRYGPNRQ